VKQNKLTARFGTKCTFLFTANPEHVFFHKVSGTRFLNIRNICSDITRYYWPQFGQKRERSIPPEVEGSPEGPVKPQRPWKRSRRTQPGSYRSAATYIWAVAGPDQGQSVTESIRPKVASCTSLALLPCFFLALPVHIFTKEKGQRKSQQAEQPCFFLK